MLAENLKEKYAPDSSFNASPNGFTVETKSTSFSFTLLKPANADMSSSTSQIPKIDLSALSVEQKETPVYRCSLSKEMEQTRVPKYRNNINYN